MNIVKVDDIILYYSQELKLGLHPFTIMTSNNLVRLYRKELSVELLPDRKQLFKQKLNNYKSSKGYFIFSLPYCFKSLKLASKVSKLFATKLCVYPEKWFTTSKIRAISYSESFCTTYHISYLNSQSVISYIFTFLGDETIRDRYHYAIYIQKYYSNSKKRLEKLHHDYITQGFERISKI